MATTILNQSSDLLTLSGADLLGQQVRISELPNILQTGLMYSLCIDDSIISTLSSYADEDWNAGVAGSDQYSPTSILSQTISLKSTDGSKLIFIKNGIEEYGGTSNFQIVVIFLTYPIVLNLLVITHMI